MIYYIGLAREVLMDAFEPNIRALITFSAAWWVCCAGIIHLAGMLPLSEAPSAVRSPGGSILIFLDAALLFGLIVLTLVFSHRELRWSSAVVVGGAIFLLSPFMTQDLPEAVKNGKAGLLLLFLLLLLALGLLFTAGDQQFLIGATH
jgi:hypothetical protein